MLKEVVLELNPQEFFKVIEKLFKDKAWEYMV
jgi:hypothetical protein